MKPLIIYHADCTDGFGAAFAAWLKLGNEAEYLPIHYNHVEVPAHFVIKIDEDPADREIYILDFSFPRIVMEWLFATAKRVVWLDHHKSAFEMWCGEYNIGMHYTEGCHAGDKQIILDDLKSGVLLAWEFFHPAQPIPRNDQDWAVYFLGYGDAPECQPAFMKDQISYTEVTAWNVANRINEQALQDHYPRPGNARIYEARLAPSEYGVTYTDVPKLIQHIDDRDRWQFKLEGSKELHAALASYKPWNFEWWQEANQQIENWDDIVGPHRLFKDGAAILRAQEQKIASVTKQTRSCRIEKLFNDPAYDNPIGLAVNSPVHISEIGHVLATTSGTYGLVYYLSADNRVKCSLRSNGEYDVSAIARAFGGGGHRNAAGFETDIETLMGWLK